MLSKWLTVCVLVVFGFLATSARADSVSIANPDFAPGPTLSSSCGTDCTYNGGPIPDWTATAGTSAGSWIPGPDQFSALPAGDTDGTAAYLGTGEIYKSLTGITLLPDTTYTLSVYVGMRADTPNASATYTFGLDSGTMQLAINGGTSADITPGSFDLETATFTTGSAADGNLTIFLTSSGPQSDFTDISLVNTPEPSSLLLSGIGLLSLLLVGTKFRRNVAGQTA